eukprot:5898388-Pleurochrysis_carterae.AAC.2
MVYKTPLTAHGHRRQSTAATAINHAAYAKCIGRLHCTDTSRLQYRSMSLQPFIMNCLCLLELLTWRRSSTPTIAAMGNAVRAAIADAPDELSCAYSNQEDRPIRMPGKTRNRHYDK